MITILAAVLGAVVVLQSWLIWTLNQDARRLSARALHAERIVLALTALLHPDRRQVPWGSPAEFYAAQRNLRRHFPWPPTGRVNVTPPSPTQTPRWPDAGAPEQD